MKDKKKKEFDSTNMNFGIKPIQFKPSDFEIDNIRPIEMKPFKFDGAKFSRDLDKATNRIGKDFDASMDKNKTIKEIIQDFKQSSK